MPGISAGSSRNRSCESTTMSAAFPGVIEPRSFSAKFANAEPIV